MAYEIDVTVTVTYRPMSSGPAREGLRGASLSQTVTRTTGGPNERYLYDPAEAAADEATEVVLKMMESAYGRATVQD